MTRKVFLRNLRFALIFAGFRRNERNDIVADYDVFLRQEQMSEQSGEVVTNELDEPVTIALNLVHQSKQKHHIGEFVLKNWGIFRPLIGLIIFLGITSIYRSITTYPFNQFGLILTGTGIAYMALVILTLHTALKEKITAPNFYRSQAFLIVSNALILFSALFFIAFSSSNVSLRLAYWMLNSVQIQSFWFTTGLAEIRLVLLLIAIVIATLALIGVWNGKAERFITAIHAVGFAVYLDIMHRIWDALFCIELYWTQIYKIWTIYAVALAVTVISAWFMKRRNGRMIRNVT